MSPSLQYEQSQDRRPAPPRCLRTRDLGALTHYALRNGKQVTIELYNGAFPMDTSPLDGFDWLLAEASELHSALQDNPPTDELLQIVKTSTKHATQGGSIERGFMAGTFLAEVEHGLTDAILISPSAQTETWQACLGQVIAKLANLSRHFWQSDHAQNIAPEVYPLADLSQLFRPIFLPGIIAVEALSQIAHREGRDSLVYMQALAAAPHKARTFGSIIGDRSFEDTYYKAKQLSRTCNTTNTSVELYESYAPPRRSSYALAAGYSLVGYWKVREAGFSKEEAVNVLFANAKRLGALTWRATDALPFNSALLATANTRSQLPREMSKFDIKQYDGEPYPRITIPTTKSTGWAYKNTLAAKHLDTLNRRRRNGGSCAIRHALPNLPTADGQNRIQAFDNYITDRIGVSPNIVSDDKHWVDPSALIMALSTAVSEHMGLYE